LFCYRNGDDSSVVVAEYYRRTRGLEVSDLLGLSCSSVEILPNYATFKTEVEDSVAASVSLNRPDYIVMGMNVPGGFLDGNSVVSSTSRLASLPNSYTGPKLNPIFDRSVSWSDADADRVIPTSRLDGPDVQFVKRIMDFGAQNSSRFIARGTVFVDPYTEVLDESHGEYREEMLDFVDNITPLLNTDVYTTIPITEYDDLFIPKLIGDSFAWMCGGNSTSDSFFDLSNAPRVFAYNANVDNKTSIRDTSSRALCDLALGNGYSSTAGLASQETADSFLRPTPFFGAILLGDSIGRSQFRSTPYLDNSMMMYGDPLVKVGFQGARAIGDDLTQDQIAARVFEKTEFIALWLDQESNSLKSSLQEAVRSDDLNISLNCIRPLFNTVESLDRRKGSMLRPAIRSILSILGKGSEASEDDLNEMVAQYSLAYSSPIYEAFESEGILIDNPATRRTPGSWEVSFDLVDADFPEARLYSLELQVSDNYDFSSIVATSSSDSDIGWEVESTPFFWNNIPQNGLNLGNVGRKIRYRSDTSKSLTPGKMYYVRIRQVSGEDVFAWRESRLAVFK
jgi:hypothetical protein